MSPPIPRKALERQAAGNIESEQDWALYEQHRVRLSALISARAGGRVCVLGAGNGNDLELATIAPLFEEVHLVDLDRAALERCFARQEAATRTKLRLHAPIDLSGLLVDFESWSKKPPSAAEVRARIPAAVDAIVSALPGPFSLVVSDCLFSQILLAAFRVWNRELPVLDELRTALATIHLRSMVRLLAPGGVGLLACDMNSSEFYPLDALEPAADLRAVMTEMAQAGNHFAGANPLRLRRLLREDVELAAAVKEARLLDPWVWTTAHDKLFFVFALELSRTAP